MITIGITGHTGYVGGVLSQKLLKNKELRLKSLDREKHLLLDTSTLVDFITGCDVLIHLASIIRPSDPEVLQVNVMGTANMLSTIFQYNPTCKLVFASSFEVYKASNKKELIDEAYEKGPRSLYGLSKLMGEELVSFYATHHNIKSTILRLTNIFGPSPNISTSMIAIILDRIKNNTELTIHGDGNQTRDYVYIDDVVSALELASSIPQDTNLRIMNICSGVEVSIMELVAKIEKLLDIKASTKHDNTVDGGGFRRGNNELAAELLGWTPSVNLDAGLERLVKFV